MTPTSWTSRSTPAILRLLLFMLVVIATACGGDSSDEVAPDGVATTSGAESLRVVATTPIIADMTRQIAGERAVIDAIVPLGADPHDFEPAPSDIEKAVDADLVLEHGLGYDEWAHDLIEQSGTEGHVATVTVGIETVGPVAGNDDEHADTEDHDHDHGNQDPHVWLDPGNATIMATNIRDALIDTDPEGQEIYETNANAYIAQLEELDAWIHDQIQTVPESQRKLVTTHEAFGYYVRAYDLEFVGAIIPSLETQAQPSAREVEALIQQIEQEGVKAIFLETTASSALAEQIANETGVKIVDNLYSDSLGPAGTGAETYVGMMRHNTEVIVEALR